MDTKTASEGERGRGVHPHGGKYAPLFVPAQSPSRYLSFASPQSALSHALHVPFNVGDEPARYCSADDPSGGHTGCTTFEHTSPLIRPLQRPDRLGAVVGHWRFLHVLHVSPLSVPPHCPAWNLSEPQLVFEHPVQVPCTVRRHAQHLPPPFSPNSCRAYPTAHLHAVSCVQ